MKTLIVILTLAAFLQTTILGVNLVLLVLILRTFIKPDRSNLYLAFFLGLLISLLNFTSLGTESLIFICLVELVDIFGGRFHISDNILAVPILTALVLTLAGILSSLLLHQTIQLSWIVVLWTIVVAFPVYLLLRFWEERFIVKDVKLKV